MHVYRYRVIQSYLQCDLHTDNFENVNFTGRFLMVLWPGLATRCTYLTIFNDSYYFTATQTPILPSSVVYLWITNAPLTHVVWAVSQTEQLSDASLRYTSLQAVDRQGQYRPFLCQINSNCTIGNLILENFASRITQDHKIRNVDVNSDSDNRVSYCTL